MNDRERIARAIYEQARPKSAAVWEEAADGYRGRFCVQADAVLAALDGRLLPEWDPEERNILELVHAEGLWYANFSLGMKWVSNGYAPTIPAAIRNALEADEKEST